MRITDVRLVEDCFDGSRVLRYHFDGAWTRADVQRLAPLGDLEVFADFPRPLFRVQTPEGAQIKGVEGESDCQVVFPEAGREALQARFEALFQG